MAKPAVGRACPARGIIKDMRVPLEWRGTFEEGLLLVVPPFPSARHRPTAALSARRNDFASSLARRIFIARAAPSSKTGAFPRELSLSGKPVPKLDSSSNANLAGMGDQACLPATELVDPIAHVLLGH